MDFYFKNLSQICMSCVYSCSRLREDSQIDLAMRNFFLNISLRPPTPCLETFQSKIDIQFKLCQLTAVDDTQNWPMPRSVGLQFM